MEIQMRIRLEIAAPIIALVLTGDTELARLWFAIWYVR
jgi:hypothetical protein